MSPNIGDIGVYNGTSYISMGGSHNTTWTSPNTITTSSPNIISSTSVSPMLPPAHKVLEVVVINYLAEYGWRIDEPEEHASHLVCVCPVCDEVLDEKVVVVVNDGVIDSLTDIGTDAQFNHEKECKGESNE